MQKLWLLTTFALVSACSEPAPSSTATPPVSGAAVMATDSMPPGFTDEPPAPPTSSTIVLSGGNLITETLVEDSVVVLHKGKVVTWGKRGEVDMPNDSIGIDVRGKWLVPGTEADLKSGNLPNSALLETGVAGNLLVFNTGPDISNATGDDLHAIVSEGALQIFETVSD